MRRLYTLQTLGFQLELMDGKWQWVKRFYLEGLRPSATVGEQTISVELDAAGNGQKWVKQDVVNYTVVNLDADVDSDNNNGFDDPDQNALEDSLENHSELPGKIIAVNDGDKDSDGIPDFADGFDWDTNAGSDDLNPEENFARLMIKLPSTIAPNDRVRVSYSASDPNDGGLRTGQAPNYNYQPADGHLRLWKEPGNVARAGTYIAPGEYTVSDLGQSHWKQGDDMGAARRKLVVHIR